MNKVIPVFLSIFSATTFASISDELNIRYNNIVDSCENDTPAYYCSGVTVRVTSSNAEEKPWESNGSGHSFSYIRKDTDLTSLYIVGTVGFIIKTNEDALDDNEEPIGFKCSYPFDGFSDERNLSGCGTNLLSNPEITYISCKDLNVYSTSEWVEYMENESTFQGYYDGHTKYLVQCAFDATDANSFLLSINTRSVGLSNSTLDFSEPYSWWNEMVSEAWDDSLPMPIEAFFYYDDRSEEDAVSIRDSYWNDTGVYLPVVKIDLSNKDAPFSQN